MNEFIPLSVPFLNGNERKYLNACVDTGFVSSVGEFVDRFETDTAKALQAPHAVACMNGSAALHVSLILSGVTPQDEVFVPTLTFISPVNTVRYVGAEPVFMDCDDHLNLDPVKLSEFCENECDLTDKGLINKKSGKRIAAMIVVHIFGYPANLLALSKIAAKYKIKLIEDASESVGSYYQDYEGQKRFAGTIGDFGCLSFNGNKIVTAGGGGMILTNSEEAANQAKHLTTQAKEDPFYFKHDQIGFNYRMTNLQAAVGVAQMEQLDGFIKIKRDNFAKYKEAISHIDAVELIEEPEGTVSNYWYYPLRVKDGVKTRDELLKSFAENKIGVRPLWYLNHEQKMYTSCQAYKIERSQQFWQQVLNLPCSVTLKDEEIARVVNVMEKALKS